MQDRRIAIIAAFCFIENNEFIDALKISRMLMFDEHDLIHKAVGRKLCEIGKRDVSSLELFLISNCNDIPRTALRYAIE